MPEENAPGESDEEIVTSHKKGNETAFKKLIGRYISPVYNFIARIAGKNDAKDLVQETFIKVWKNIIHFDPRKASLKTWIFTIARNTTTDFLRKRKYLVFSDIESLNYDESFKIEDDNLLEDSYLKKIENAEIMAELMDKLNPESKEILILHYKKEMTFSEIGKQLNQPSNTIKSKHRRAILELRKYLEEKK